MSAAMHQICGNDVGDTNLEQSRQHHAQVKVYKSPCSQVLTKLMVDAMWLFASTNLGLSDVPTHLGHLEQHRWRNLGASHLCDQTTPVKSIQSSHLKVLANEVHLAHLQSDAQHPAHNTLINAYKNAECNARTWTNT